MADYSVTGRWAERWGGWCSDTFGDASFTNPQNRGARVCEEGVELAQALDVDKETVLKIVERCYSRPKGEIAQEAAGVFITLLILCKALGISVLRAVAVEWRRVQRKGPDHFRAKQREKFAAGTDLVPPV